MTSLSKSIIGTDGMANGGKKLEGRHSIALLCLCVFLLLLTLSIVQDVGWLRVNNLCVIGIYALIFLLPMLIYRRKRGVKAAQLFGLHAVPMRFVPHILLISAAVCLICGALNVVGFMLFSGARANPTAMMSFTTQNPLVLFVTMVFLPAVTEELLLRGAALTEYEQYGTTRAVLITSLIFALFHANPMHLLSLFTAGVCYAIMTKLFHSIYPAIFAHLLNNAAALAISDNVDQITYILSDPLFLIFTIVLIFAVLIAALKMTEKAIAKLGADGKLRYVRRRTGASPVFSLYLFLFAAGCIAKMIATYMV